MIILNTTNVVSRSAADRYTTLPKEDTSHERQTRQKRADLLLRHCARDGGAGAAAARAHGAARRADGGGGAAAVPMVRAARNRRLRPKRRTRLIPGPRPFYVAQSEQSVKSKSTITNRQNVHVLQLLPKRLRRHIGWHSPFMAQALRRGSAASAAGIVAASAVVVVDQQDQDDDKQQPGAVALAEQVFQTHICSPPSARSHSILCAAARKVQKPARRSVRIKKRPPRRALF